jgi:hypothetical protein
MADLDNIASATPNSFDRTPLRETHLELSRDRTQHWRGNPGRVRGHDDGNSIA